MRLVHQPGRTNCMGSALIFPGRAPSKTAAAAFTEDNQFVSRQRLRISASKAVGAVPFWQ